MNLLNQRLTGSPVTLNLLFINVIMFFATIVAENFGIDLTSHLAVYQYNSIHFMPWQLITAPFMHGNLSHLFFNMFGLFMFGTIIEQVLGSKRFLLYYMACAIGATFFLWAVNAVLLQTLGLTPQDLELARTGVLLEEPTNWTDLVRAIYIYNIGMVGASGAIFGILLAFGLIFPNVSVYLYFAIPIKAKWLVIGYGLIELYLGIKDNVDDNVAHFAHLGGMIIGLLILLYWRKKGTLYFYQN